MSVNHPLLLLIFLLTFKTGLSAEIHVFVKTGTSFQLDVQTQELPKINALIWGSYTSPTIVTYITAANQVLPDSSYEKRVEFNTETFSLTLKNITKTDSGLYTARSLQDSKHFFAEYRVSVIDAVEAPVLTVNSNQSSGDSCTVNFTCRSHNLTLNSTYNSGSCSQKEVTSDRVNFLILNCSQKSIICNHSNPVSWKDDRINITQLCVINEKTPQKEESYLLWPVILGVVVTVLILAVFLVIYRKYKKGTQKEVVEGSTVYAQVKAQKLQKTNSDCHTYDIPDWVQAQTQKENGDNQPETTYCTVGQHQNQTIPPETEHTIYSVVCKQPNKKPPGISSDDASK